MSNIYSDLQYSDCINMMIALIRSSLVGNNPQIPDSQYIDWNELMDISLRNGVLSFVWDGMSVLPDDCLPSRIHRINYAMSTDEIRKRYYRQKEVLDEMIEICNKNGIRLILLKGFGLSYYYPKPELRPCGDIDIFLSGDYKKGNELFADGKCIKNSPKHSEFDFKGVHIENHYTMLDTDSVHRRKVELFLEGMVSTSVRTKDGYYILNPIANTIYLLMHSVRHLARAHYLPLRNYIDFALFIDNNRDVINTLEFRDALLKCDLVKMFDLFLYVSEWILGIKYEGLHFYVIKKDDLAVFRPFILNDGFMHNENKKDSLLMKWRRFIILTRFTRYMPKSYNNYFVNLLYLFTKSIVKYCLFSKR